MKKIAVITATRAEYSLSTPVYVDLKNFRILEFYSHTSI